MNVHVRAQTAGCVPFEQTVELLVRRDEDTILLKWADEAVDISTQGQGLHRLGLLDGNTQWSKGSPVVNKTQLRGTTYSDWSASLGDIVAVVIK